MRNQPKGDQVARDLEMNFFPGYYGLSNKFEDHLIEQSVEAVRKEAERYVFNVRLIVINTTDDCT